jgi:hypothetical protein
MDEDDDVIHSSAPSRSDMEATAIAIGKKVFTASCRIVVDVPFDQYELVVAQIPARGRTRASTRKEPTSTKKLLFRGRNIVDLKFHFVDGSRGSSVNDKSDDVAEVAEDDPEQQLCFLAMKLQFEEDDDKRKLGDFLDSRVSASMDRHAVVEFRNDSELRHCLAHFRDNDAWKEMLATGELFDSDYAKYSHALLKHYKSEKTSRLSSPHGKARQDSFLAGRGEDDVLVVYPFGGDATEMEKSADGLTEAKGREEPDMTLLHASDEPDNDDSAKFSGRGHYMTIRVGDYERLEPVEYLNDTLIDFWMQWYVRAHPGRSAADVPQVDLTFFSQVFAARRSIQGTYIFVSLLHCAEEE